MPTQYVQLFTVAAITLGLIQGRMHAWPARTASISCSPIPKTAAACGDLVRHREKARDYADRNFIRVDGPAMRYDEIIACVKNGEDSMQFESMCLSMISHPIPTTVALCCWSNGPWKCRRFRL